MEQQRRSSSSSMTRPNVDKDEENVGHSHADGRNVKWYGNSGSLAVFYKTKYAIIIQHGTALLGICPRKMKRHVNTETCTHMFTVVLFVISKI